MKNPENIRDLEKQAAVFLHLGGAAEQKHDFEAAVTFYRRAIALEPTRLDVWYFAHNNLGFSLNQLGRFSDGEIFCQDAIRIDPSRPNGHKNLGLSLAGQGLFPAAAQAYIAAINACPGDTRSLVLLLKLLQAHPELKPGFQVQAERCEQLAKAACGVDPKSVFGLPEDEPNK
ncbi:MAG: tetratricopeptide repeat protein [Verrucomicrobiota bacterium]